MEAELEDQVANLRRCARGTYIHHFQAAILVEEVGERAGDTDIQLPSPRDVQASRQRGLTGITKVYDLEVPGAGCYVSQIRRAIERDGVRKPRSTVSAEYGRGCGVGEIHHPNSRRPHGRYSQRAGLIERYPRTVAGRKRGGHASRYSRLRGITEVNDLQEQGVGRRVVASNDRRVKGGADALRNKGISDGIRGRRG